MPAPRAAEIGPRLISAGEPLSIRLGQAAGNACCAV